MTETVAFLFADVEGSTRLLAEVGAEAYGESLQTYRSVVERAVTAEGGHVVDREGDGLFAVLPTAAGALRAAAGAQGRLAETTWPGEAELRVRMGVHAGEAERHEDGYVGIDVHRAARVADAAWGGQIVVSDAARALTGDAIGGELELRDLGEHRLKDLDRVEHLHQLVGPNIEGEFPLLRTLEGTPNNLPVQPTSFVGRQRELEEVVELVRDDRLVTITGVGGSGKTRVALRAVAELITDFPGGAWFVELGAITDPGLVDGALLEALGLPQPSRMGQREAAIEHLADRPAALLVDNCEHLIDAAADLAAAVVSGAPECTVVATSREVLGVPGEVVYGLRSMALPSDADATDVEALSDSDAVRLFVERASDVRPGFAVTEDNAAAVVEICRRLDGMPLALELAAARLRTFGPDKIAELLDQRFRLLTGGSRTALPRQQTLTAAIEWSYRLLDADEQAFLSRLSVFQGGFTFEAATAVATDGELGEVDVLELLPALVDKSLVVAEDENDDDRYRLLETLRQFARDRLEETGEADDVRRRHVAFYRDLVAEALEHILGPDELAWRRRIEAELDNLRQAMTVALESDDPAAALELAVGFAAHAQWLSGWSEALSWIERTLAAADERVDDALRARALVAHGALLDSSPEQERAVEPVERGIEVLRRLDASGADTGIVGGYRGLPHALITRAVVLFHQGRIGEDNEVFTEIVSEALDIARRRGDDTNVALALGNLAHHRDPWGDPAEARELFDEALAAWRTVGSDRGLAIVSQQRAMFEFDAGDLEASREAWEAAIRHAERAQAETSVLFWRASLAALDVELGDASGAERFAAAVRELFTRPGVRQGVGAHQNLLVFRAGIDAAVGRFERVAVAAGASNAEAERGRPVRWDLVDHFERVTDAAREGLGDERFEEMVAEGEAMSHEEVADFLTVD